MLRATIRKKNPWPVGVMAAGRHHVHHLQRKVLGIGDRHEDLFGDAGGGLRGRAGDEEVWPTSGRVRRLRRFRGSRSAPGGGIVRHSPNVQRRSGLVLERLGEYLGLRRGTDDGDLQVVRLRLVEGAR